MSNIIPRKIRFEYEPTIEFPDSDEMLSEQLPLLGLSLTLPHLEPYLIRTMKAAIPKISDPQIAEDARNFSIQEGHHYRNHQVFNEIVRGQFSEATANDLLAIEAAQEADYQRFTKKKSLKFNTAYAEGFEAMTCSMALGMADQGGFSEGGAAIPGGELWAWHLAEEIEHRTVAFEVYDHLVGSYLYRVGVGTWAQFHFMSYVRRLTNCMAKALGRQLVNPRSESQRSARRRYFKTWNPNYTPRDIEVPEVVGQLLATYTERARATSA